MKYVSFSLWGDNPLYNIGTIRNAELMPSIYPEWKMIVYYDSSVPFETIKCLQDLNCETFEVDDFPYQSFWRFFASDLENCDYVIFRDADSRINMREKYAVDEWISQGTSLHVMRDHPAHAIPYGNNSLGILAGMWGLKGRKIPMTEMIKKFVVNKENKYGIDQTFLKTIYSIFQEDRTTHDDLFEKKPFPKLREGVRFIGERIGPDEKPVTNDWKVFEK